MVWIRFMIFRWDCYRDNKAFLQMKPALFWNSFRTKEMASIFVQRAGLIIAGFDLEYPTPGRTHLFWADDLLIFYSQTWQNPWIEAYFGLIKRLFLES